MFVPSWPLWRACMLAAVVACAPRSTAQTWSKTIGGLSSEVGHGVVATDDGGCIISGSTGSFGAGGGDLYLLKLNAEGELDWSRAIGTPGVESGWRLNWAPAGTLLVAGSTNNGSGGGYDGWLVHTDASGGVLWQRSYGGADWDFLYDVAPLGNGAYAVGQTYSRGAGAGDAWLVRVDQAGDTLWTRTLGGALDDEFRSVQVTTDGGCVVAGTVGVAEGNTDLLVAKYDASGGLEWQTPIGGTAVDAGFSVAVKADGGYVVCGHTRSFADNQRIFLATLLADGSVDWTKDIGDSGTWGAREVHQRPDGGFTVAGFTDAFGAGNRDMYFLFTDNAGAFEQGRTYGQSENDEAWAFVATPDGGYVVVGVASGYGPGTNAVFAVKGDANGNTSSTTIAIELDPLDVEDLGPSSASALFPNPASPGTTVSWRMPDLHPTRVLLLDLQGRALVDEGVAPTTQRLVVPLLPTGLYRVVLVGRDGPLLNAPLLVRP